MAALKEVGERISSGSSSRFELTVTGSARPNAPRVDEALFRIGQEAVSNAVRHARALNVRMELAYEAAGIRLAVRDDGRGFDLDSVHAKVEAHWGLADDGRTREADRRTASP